MKKVGKTDPSAKSIEVKPCPLCGRDPIHIGTMNGHGDQGLICSCGLQFKRHHPQLIPKECYRDNIKDTLRALEERTLRLCLKDWNRRGTTRRKQVS